MGNLIKDVINFTFLYKKFTVFCTCKFYDGIDYKYIIYSIKNKNGIYLDSLEFFDLKDEIKEQVYRNKALNEHFIDMLKLAIYHYEQLHAGDTNTQQG